MTVAHEIYLGRKKKKNGNYRSPFITIWHVDPEKRALGCKADDSCGWFSPSYTEGEAAAIKKLAVNQYDQLFARKVAIKEGKSYAGICYNQDIYGAIYWSWRAIKAIGKKGWQYGKRPSVKELDAIYCLATNPADNMQSQKINNLEDYTDFLFTVWRLFRKFHRPRYKHPRWHIHHWKIQFHPWHNFRRRYFDKCCICGKRGFKGSAIGDWNGSRIWHPECDRSIAKPPQQNI